MHDGQHNDPFGINAEENTEWEPMGQRTANAPMYLRELHRPVDYALHALVDFGQKLVTQPRALYFVPSGRILEIALRLRAYSKLKTHSF